MSKLEKFLRRLFHLENVLFLTRTPAFFKIGEVVRGSVITRIEEGSDECFTVYGLPNNPVEEKC